MNYAVIRFIAQGEVSLVPLAYRARGYNCSYGQDITGTQRPVPSTADWHAAPHNHRNGGCAIPMHLTFAKRVCECPICASSSVRRSARTGFVERIWFRLAFVWPYRCDDCDSRFWGFLRS